MYDLKKEGKSPDNDTLKTCPASSNPWSDEGASRFSRSLFEHSPSAIIIYEVKNSGATGADYVIADANDVCLKTEGWDRSVIGKRLSDLRPGVDEYGIVKAFQTAYLTGETVLFPAKIFRGQDRDVWFENRIFRLPTGEVVSIYSDITESKLRELRIEHMSRHDALTNLLNRAAFEEKMEEIEFKQRIP